MTRTDLKSVDKKLARHQIGREVQNPNDIVQPTIQTQSWTKWDKDNFQAFIDFIKAINNERFRNKDPDLTIDEILAHVDDKNKVRSHNKI